MHYVKGKTAHSHILRMSEVTEEDLYIMLFDKLKRIARKFLKDPTEPADLQFYG
jgi:hypothetical protein